MSTAVSGIDLAQLRKRAYNLRWATLPEGVIPLTAADPDYPSPQPIADALARYAQDRYWSYGPSAGITSFRESLANFYVTKRNIVTNPAFVIATDTAAFGIYITCKAFLNAGDEAIIFDPVDFLFQYSIAQHGATAVRYAIPPGSDNINFDGLERLITAKTKMICLCNPLNPTGKVFTKAELTILGEIACKHNLMILSDEIWSDIIFQPHTFTGIASINDAIKNRTVIVTGFSKSYGLAGLRIGAVTAFNEQTYQLLMQASLHTATIHGANTAGQVAATAALDHCQEWLAEVVSHLQKMSTLCVDTLNNIPNVTCIAPEGCYVAFANIKATGMSSSQLAEILQHKAKVAVVPGKEEWFGPGAEGYIRLSFATSEEILGEAMHRIQTTMSML